MVKSLRDLARQHVAGRLTKEQRHAELRAAGYDPDGEDGCRYRRFFDAIKYGEFAGGVVRDVTVEQGPPQVVVLWDVPQSEHGAWLAAGCGEESWAAYQRRLVATIESIEARGVRVRTISPTVAAVVETLAAKNLPNSPEGRAAALAILSGR